MFLMVLFLALLVEIGQSFFLFVLMKNFILLLITLQISRCSFRTYFFSPNLIVSAYNTFYLCKHALKNEFNILRSLHKYCELALITENKHDDIGCLFSIFSVVCFRRVLEV